jgi:hypothetical protein
MTTKPRAKGRSRIGGTPEGLKRATAVLDVLGGLHTPGEAARVLGIGVPRYYTLETQALEGLVQACEPRGRGPGVDPNKIVRDQVEQIQRLQSEIRRLQALVRVSHRALGLAGLKGSASSAGGGTAATGSKTPPSRSKGSTKKSRKPRAPAARALRISKRLKEKSVESADPGVASGRGRAGVAPSAASSGGDPAHDCR